MFVMYSRSLRKGFLERDGESFFGFCFDDVFYEGF